MAAGARSSSSSSSSAWGPATAFSPSGAAVWAGVARAPQSLCSHRTASVAYPAMETNKMCNFRMAFLPRHYVLPKARKVGLKLPQECEEDCGGPRGAGRRHRAGVWYSCT